MMAWNGVTAGLTHLLDAYGLIAIFVVMLLKETGILVPIPGDLIMLGAFFVIGLAGWLLLRRRGRSRQQGATAATLEALSDWADASCPVCLAIGAVNHVQHKESLAALQARQ
jgi:TRAP-type C4-dicarboxylate transport system permease small subunit